MAHKMTSKEALLKLNAWAADFKAGMLPAEEVRAVVLAITDGALASSMLRVWGLDLNPEE